MLEGRDSDALLTVRKHGHTVTTWPGMDAVGKIQGNLIRATRTIRPDTGGKRCCGSCGHRDILEEIARICWESLLEFVIPDKWRLLSNLQPQPSLTHCLLDATYNLKHHADSFCFMGRPAD